MTSIELAETSGLLSEAGSKFQAVKGRPLSGASYKESHLALSEHSVAKVPKVPPTGFLSSFVIGILSISLTKIHIIRDHFQIMGVIFSSSYNTLVGLAKTCSDVFGGIGDVVAFNFVDGFQLDASAVVGTLIVVFGGAALCVVAFWAISFGSLSTIVKSRKEVARQGHESKDVVHVKQSQPWKLHAVKLTFLITTSLMLGVVQSSFEIILCDRSSPIMSYYLKDGQACSDLGNRNSLIAFAIIMLFIFVLAMPTMFSIMIERHSPRPDEDYHIMNLEGYLEQFSDRVYQDIVNTDRNQVLNPFRDLYEGLRYPYRFYNVSVIVFKTVLCGLTVVVSASGYTDSAKDTLNAIVTLVLMLFSTYYQYRLHPFSTHTDQMIENAGCVTRILTPIAALICIGSGVDSSAASAVGAIILLVNIIGLIVIIYFTANDFPGAIRVLKRASGRAHFTDTAVDIEGRLGSEAIRKWQLDRELKHRVWQPFWTSLFKEKFETVTKRCWSKRRNNPMMERLTSLCDSVKLNGTKAAMEYWENYWSIVDKGLKADLFNLQGRDVIFHGHFGKFYCHPFPLKAVFVPDQEFEVKTLTIAEMFDIVRENNTEEAKKSIKIRKTLRAIARGYARRNIHFNLQGNKKVMSMEIDGGDYTVQEEGMTADVNRDGIEMEAGFNVIIRAAEGGNGKESCFALVPIFHGVEDIGSSARTAPRGEQLGPVIGIEGQDMLHIKNEELWNKFVNSAKDAGVPVDTNLKAIQAEEEAYRAKFIDQDSANQSLLCDTFFEAIFEYPAINREHLEFYLRNRELNAEVKAIADDREALDFIYEKMASVIKSESSTLWYVFWDAFWESNGDSAMVSKHPEVFDPSEAGSIAYKIIERSELEEELASLGVRLVDKDTLDALYARLKSPENYPKIDIEEGPLECFDACCKDLGYICDCLCCNLTLSSDPDPVAGGISRKEMMSTENSMVFIKDVTTGRYITVDKEKRVRLKDATTAEPTRFLMRDYDPLEKSFTNLSMLLEVVDSENKASDNFLGIDDKKEYTMCAKNGKNSGSTFFLKIQQDTEKEHYGALILETGLRKVSADGDRIMSYDDEKVALSRWAFVRRTPNDTILNHEEIMIRDDSVIDGESMRKNALKMSAISAAYFEEATKRGALVKAEVNLPPTSIA